nr:unnamed protein product [Callosobruchus chinensis]
MSYPPSNQGQGPQMQGGMYPTPYNTPYPPPPPAGYSTPNAPGYAPVPQGYGPAVPGYGPPGQYPPPGPYGGGPSVNGDRADVMPDLRSDKKIHKYLWLKLKKLFKKKAPKATGYYRLYSDEEQRWLDEYAARNSQLPTRIGIPYYD